jgi:hypothetical protein
VVVDSTGDGTVTVPPAPDASRLHTEQLGDALLLEAERAERRAEFDRSRAACFHVKLHRRDLPESRQNQQSFREASSHLRRSAPRSPSPP